MGRHIWQIIIGGRMLKEEVKKIIDDGIDTDSKADSICGLIKRELRKSVSMLECLTVFEVREKEETYEEVVRKSEVINIINII